MSTHGAVGATFYNTRQSLGYARKGNRGRYKSRRQRWQEKKMRQATLAAMRGAVANAQYFDVANSASSTSSGSIVQLTQIPMTSTGSAGGRTGFKVWIDSIQIRIQAVAGYATVLAADVYNTVRVIITRLKTASSVFGVASYPGLWDNPDPHTDWSVLFDSTVHLKNVSSGEAGAGVNGGNAPEGQWWIRNIKVNKPMSFFLQTTTSDTFGALQMYHVSDSSATPNPTLNWSIRVFFRNA